MFEKEPRRDKRITFPINVNNSGPTHNSPDAPQVEVTNLRELGTFFPNGIRREQRSGVEISKEKIINNGFTLIRGEIVIPQERQPLTPVFRTSRGRIYGGGTSEKSLRKARKNGRRKHI